MYTNWNGLHAVVKLVSVLTTKMKDAHTQTSTYNGACS